MAKDLGTLRDEAAQHVARGRLDKALEAYTELEAREPTSPQWSKRRAETHRRLGQMTAAIAAFERACERFVADGFLVQAMAMCKLILQIDPRRSSAAQRLSALTAEARGPQGAKPAAPTTRGPATVRPGARRPAAAAQAPATTAPAAPAAVAKPTRPPTPVTGVPTKLTARPITTPIARPAAPAPVAPASPPQVAKPPSRTPPTLPPSAPLDVLELSTLVPRARQLARHDGSMSGMFLLPIAEPGDDVDIEEIELSPDDAIADDDAAPDAAPDEGGAELEWPGEVEIVEAAANPTLIELTQGAKLALLATPLFSRLPARALERLIAQMALVQLEPGDLVFGEGDHGSTMYVISEGEVAVHSGDRELARLGPGAFFGEIALVTELPRSATVRAITRVEALAIDRDVIREAIAARPAIVDVLLGFVRDRLVDRVARTSALFQPFGDADRASLSSRFELLEVVAGTAMLEMGVRADGLYVLLAGRVEVLRGHAHLASLGPGDVFGEMSLLRNVGASASVVASSRVLALRMPAPVFQEVVMTHPQVLAHLGELIARRGGDDATGDDILDLHLDLV